MLLAILAFPALAQTGSITITIDCGTEENVTVENDTDETLVLEGINSSEDRNGNPEDDLDVTIAAGESGTAAIGEGGGVAGSIFANGEEETATVFISGEVYAVACGPDDAGSATFEFGELQATPEPTTEPGVVG